MEEDIFAVDGVITGNFEATIRYIMSQDMATEIIKDWLESSWEMDDLYDAVARGNFENLNQEMLMQDVLNDISFSLEIYGQSMYGITLVDPDC